MLQLVFPRQAIPVLTITALLSSGSRIHAMDVTAKQYEWLENTT